jgi:hypothetical protein
MLGQIVFLEAGVMTTLTGKTRLSPLICLL